MWLKDEISSICKSFLCYFSVNKSACPGEVIGLEQLFMRPPQACSFERMIDAVNFNCTISSTGY